MEHTVYDEDGQLLSGSTWTTPCRAPRRAEVRVESHPVPATTNPLGAKGCGEAGCAGSLPSVMNAVVDALSERRQAHRHAGHAGTRMGSAQVVNQE